MSGARGRHGKAREEIAGALTQIFNPSLATVGGVSDDWRAANVVPLFKKGCRDEPGNCRPVSPTSVGGKLLKENIYLHSERQSLIRESQHGFVRGRSRRTNVIEHFEEVTRCVDEGSAVNGSLY